ncbi:MAG TPA: ferritin-like domain-containing protein [Candidatus Polarisedimenticolaceae bacterium]
MQLQTLEQLYVEELRDLWSAESQIAKALPKMIKAATHPKLKKAFVQHERQSKEHVKRLARIFKDLGKSPKGKTCVGMVGLLKEGAELIKEKPDPNVLDAGLICSAQHVEHYEMAGYGTCRTWARLLQHEDHAEILQQTLNEEGDTDKFLTALAEASINIEAENRERRPWSRAAGA